MIPGSPVCPSSKKLALSAGVEEEVTQVATTPSDGAPETTDTVVRVKKFHIAYYRRENLLLKVDLFNGPEIQVRDKSCAHVLFPVLFIRASGIDQVRRTLFVTTSATATHSKAREGATFSTPYALDEAAFVVLPDETHRP